MGGSLVGGSLVGGRQRPRVVRCLTSADFFVKRFALRYWSVVCPVCLSVCDVRALWPNGWTDQDETWHAGKTRPWPLC